MCQALCYYTLLILACILSFYCLLLSDCKLSHSLYHKKHSDSGEGYSSLGEGFCSFSTSRSLIITTTIITPSPQFRFTHIPINKLLVYQVKFQMSWWSGIWVFYMLHLSCNFSSHTWLSSVKIMFYVFKSSFGLNYYWASFPVLVIIISSIRITVYSIWRNGRNWG